MKIDKKLNLVIPLERDDDTKIYVHSSPISMAVFETYYLVMAKTFSSIYNEGLGVTAGPRIAALVLKRVSENMGIWEGESGVRNGLVNEMRRLTNVIAPGENGWQSIPLQEAINKNLIDEDELSEVENALTFFTVAYRLHRKAEREAILNGASRLWGGQIESLNSTEYMSSLQTSTTDVNFGTKPTENLSSIPS